LTDAERRQRAYYAATAGAYDAVHLGDEEHNFALQMMLGAIRHYARCRIGHGADARVPDR
jgi:hypothetical protein